MDKELIAMCDVSEIQDRWEPTKGEYWEDFAEETKNFDYKKAHDKFWQKVNEKYMEEEYY